MSEQKSAKNSPPTERIWDLLVAGKAPEDNDVFLLESAYNVSELREIMRDRRAVVSEDTVASIRVVISLKCKKALLQGRDRAHLMSAGWVHLLATFAAVFPRRGPCEACKDPHVENNRFDFFVHLLTLGSSANLRTFILEDCPRSADANSANLSGTFFEEMVPGHDLQHQWSTPPRHAFLLHALNLTLRAYDEAVRCQDRSAAVLLLRMLICAAFYEDSDFVDSVDRFLRGAKPEACGLDFCKAFCEMLKQMQQLREFHHTLVMNRPDLDEMQFHYFSGDKQESEIKKQIVDRINELLHGEKEQYLQHKKSDIPDKPTNIAQLTLLVRKMQPHRDRDVRDYDNLFADGQEDSLWSFQHDQGEWRLEDPTRSRVFKKCLQIQYEGGYRILALRKLLGLEDEYSRRRGLVSWVGDGEVTFYLILMLLHKVVLNGPEKELSLEFVFPCEIVAKDFFWHPSAEKLAGELRAACKEELRDLKLPKDPLRRQYDNIDDLLIKYCRLFDEDKHPLPRFWSLYNFLERSVLSATKPFVGGKTREFKTLTRLTGDLIGHLRQSTPVGTYEALKEGLDAMLADKEARKLLSESPKNYIRHPTFMLDLILHEEGEFRSGVVTGEREPRQMFMVPLIAEPGEASEDGAPVPAVLLAGTFLGLENEFSPFITFRLNRFLSALRDTLQPLIEIMIARRMQQDVKSSNSMATDNAALQTRTELHRGWSHALKNALLPIASSADLLWKRGNLPLRDLGYLLMEAYVKALSGSEESIRAQGLPVTLEAIAETSANRIDEAAGVVLMDSAEIFTSEDGRPTPLDFDSESERAELVSSRKALQDLGGQNFAANVQWIPNRIVVLNSRINDLACLNRAVLRATDLSRDCALVLDPGSHQFTGTKIVHKGLCVALRTYVELLCRADSEYMRSYRAALHLEPEAEAKEDELAERMQVFASELPEFLDEDRPQHEITLSSMELDRICDARGLPVRVKFEVDGDIDKMEQMMGLGLDRDAATVCQMVVWEACLNALKHFRPSNTTGSACIAFRLTSHPDTITGFQFSISNSITSDQFRVLKALDQKAFSGKISTDFAELLTGKAGKGRFSGLLSNMRYIERIGCQGGTYSSEVGAGIEVRPTAFCVHLYIPFLRSGNQGGYE